MMAKETAIHARGSAYGEHRKFRGLEAFAIQQRLNQARNWLKNLMLQAPSAHILELGCGFYGSNLHTLREKFPTFSFTGVDLSVSQDETDIELISADISHWKPKQKYDGVLSLAVAEHLIDPVHHFQLLSECTKEGGWIGMTSPTPQSHAFLKLLALFGIFDRSEIADHKLYLTLNGIRALAESSKLTVEESKVFSFGLNQWALLRKS